jgi:hypothetical protein
VLLIKFSVSKSATSCSCKTFSWRWKSLEESRDYRLVNITASSQPDLERAIEKWMQDSNAAVSLQP